MHIPDGFLDPKMSGGLLGAAAAVLGFCMAKVMQAVTVMVPEKVLAVAGAGLEKLQAAGRRALSAVGEKKLKEMAAAASLIFSLQMFNFPIPSGTSGHLIGGVLAAVWLGPFAGTIVLSVVLAVQSLMFADGGLMALGANIFNLAVIGCLLSYSLYAALKKRFNETVSVAAASWLSVVLASLACAVEIGLSGTVGLKEVTSAMFKTHSVIALAEAGITVCLLKVLGRDQTE